MKQCVTGVRVDAHLFTEQNRVHKQTHTFVWNPDNIIQLNCTFMDNLKWSSASHLYGKQLALYLTP